MCSADVTKERVVLRTHLGQSKKKKIIMSEVETEVLLL